MQYMPYYRAPDTCLRHRWCSVFPPLVCALHTLPTVSYRTGSRGIGAASYDGRTADVERGKENSPGKRSSWARRRCGSAAGSRRPRCRRTRPSCMTSASSARCPKRRARRRRVLLLDPVEVAPRVDGYGDGVLVRARAALEAVDALLADRDGEEVRTAGADWTPHMSVFSRTRHRGSGGHTQKHLYE